MQTQSERLLEYLKEHESINPLEAWLKLGIYRVASPVHDLRREGHFIISDREVVKNRFGEECRVASYKYDPTPTIQG